MSLLQRICLPLSQRFHPVPLSFGSNVCHRSLIHCANFRNNIYPLKSSLARIRLSVKYPNESKLQYYRSITTLSNVSNSIALLSKSKLYRSNMFHYSFARFKSMSSSRSSQRNKTVMNYVLAGAILVIGFSYAAVPLYTVFCQATGLGGEVKVGHDEEKVETMSRVANRQLVIRFNADTAASMRWNFRPQQSEIKVFPGETALAFYSAINPTDKPIIGISTYNVVPFDAAQYFNKIQCFCFEEQRLNPHEQVDMPVFFYIDPEFVEDPKMGNVDIITLSYTFFEAKEGLVLPDPLTKPSM